MLAQDLAGIARSVWQKHGVTPSELFDRLTPSQFLVLFVAPEKCGFDRVEELTKHNDARGRRGLRPAIPKWL